MAELRTAIEDRKSRWQISLLLGEQAVSGLGVVKKTHANRFCCCENGWHCRCMDGYPITAGKDMPVRPCGNRLH